MTLASLQILLAMPLDVRLNNIEFQHAQRSGAPDEQIFHRRVAKVDSHLARALTDDR